MPRAPSSTSVETQIGRRIARSPKGTIFSAATFTKLGSRAAIDLALARLAKAGKIRRLSRGLYDKPRQDPDFGALWPTPQSVIDAIQKQHRIRIQPTGQYAANLLGLSEQVPAKIELLANIGKSRLIRAGPMRITLKATSPRNVAAANSLTGLIIQALKSLGPRHITPQHIAHLQTTLPASERRKLLSRLHLAPIWMRPHLQAIITNKRASQKKSKA